MTKASLGFAASRARQRKEIILKVLLERDLNSILRLSDSDRNVSRTLLGLLYHSDETVCWRSLEALGLVSGRIAKNDSEALRRILQRLFWTMNDESGSVGWRSPEAIGEVLYNSPIFISEFGRMLASFLREEPFERGSHYAIMRITHLRPDIFREYSGALLESLGNADPAIRGYALIALKKLARKIPEQKLNTLKNDKSQFPVYNFKSGKIELLTLDTVAKGPSL
jgi:hypothetical protein